MNNIKVYKMIILGIDHGSSFISAMIIPIEVVFGVIADLFTVHETMKKHTKKQEKSAKFWPEPFY